MFNEIATIRARSKHFMNFLDTFLEMKFKSWNMTLNSQELMGSKSITAHKTHNMTLSILTSIPVKSGQTTLTPYMPPPLLNFGPPLKSIFSMFQMIWSKKNFFFFWYKKIFFGLRKFFEKKKKNFFLPIYFFSLVL